MKVLAHFVVKDYHCIINNSICIFTQQECAEFAFVVFQHLVGTVQAVDTLHPTTAEIRYRHVLKGMHNIGVGMVF